MAKFSLEMHTVNPGLKMWGVIFWAANDWGFVAFPVWWLHRLWWGQGLLIIVHIAGLQLLGTGTQSLEKSYMSLFTSTEIQCYTIRRVEFRSRVISDNFSKKCFSQVCINLQRHNKSEIGFWDYWNQTLRIWINPSISPFPSSQLCCHN